MAIENMQKAVAEVGDWCKWNKMTVNAKKTKHMLVLRNNDVRDEADMLSVNFNGESLANVKSYKYLGIDLDGNLL